MQTKLTQEEEKYIRMLLKSKPTDERMTQNKKWLDHHVKTMLSKYKKSNKLF